MPLTTCTIAREMGGVRSAARTRCALIRKWGRPRFRMSPACASASPTTFSYESRINQSRNERASTLSHKFDDDDTIEKPTCLMEVSKCMFWFVVTLINTPLCPQYNITIVAATSQCASHTEYHLLY